MIDNFEQIKTLLKFKDPMDFVQLYIFKRKKDQLNKDNHQSVRTIKSYSIESLEQLDKKKYEIIDLCEMFKARAYIHLSCHNHKDVGLLMIETLAKRIREGNYSQRHLFDSIVGQMHTKDKKWIIDIDNKEPREELIGIINSCKPIGQKCLSEIPTKQGYHLITKPFDIKEFREKWQFDIDIQKSNPTLLYYPNSLEL